MTLREEVEPEISTEPDPRPVRASEVVLHAWERQCDPRLPRCLAEADDRLHHLRECKRCRARDDWY